MALKVLFTNNPPLIKYGLAPGFAALGHETQVLGLWQLDPESQGRLLNEHLSGFRPDFALAEGHAVGLHLPTLFSRLRQHGVPLVYWATEDPVLYRTASQTYAAEALLTLTTVQECVRGYRAGGHRADTLLFGCNPDFHRPVPPRPEYTHDIVLVASNYDSRYHQVANLVLPLVAGGYDLRVWGPWWDDPDRPTRLPDRVLGGRLPYEHLPAVYASARIVLGLHAVDSSRSQTSMRTYEALGCGAFYLTHFTPAHGRRFRHGRHLVWSHSAAETLRLVDRYLSNDAARRRIAAAGRRLVYARDTYAHRAEKVIRLVSQLL